MTGIHRFHSVLSTCALMICVSALSACKGGGGDSAGAATGASANTAPSILGPATTSAAPNVPYSFKPTASDPEGDTLSFQIQNKPAWATFNTLTGELSGTPTAAHTGSFTDIVISASDGKTSASLAAFSIEVATGAATLASRSAVTLSWIAPTHTVDGQPLTDLAGYVISFGTSQDALANSVVIDNPSIDRYVFDTLASGTYYFGVRALSASGAHSELSQLVSRAVK